jgi:hypothetical protein
MTGLGYERNPHDICVFNKTGKRGLQCTATVHVDDLLITSVDESMIESLAEGLRLRYGEITKSNGNILNYLGMVIDFSHPGENRVAMKGFVDDMLKSSGVTGGARTPATEGLDQCEDVYRRVIRGTRGREVAYRELYSGRGNRSGAL